MPFHHLRTLWRETINHPIAVGLQRVAKPIVQTIGAPLPELHRLRFEPKTAPMRWQRDRFVGIALRHLRQARVKYAARIQDLALIGCPGPELARRRSRMKISF